ncbi:hypothetical protein GJ496_000451 [Pomphorhynchus laevis]|nr:hypothetical protein GJ496_000451 [Pomphorhynchus laevis]
MACKVLCSKHNTNNARIRKRIVEHDIIDAFRDVVLYIVFLIVVLMIASPEIENTTVLLRTNHGLQRTIFNEQEILRIHDFDTLMDWLHIIGDRNMFSSLRRFDCSRTICSLSRTSDPTTYVIKWIRMQQVRTRPMLCPRTFLEENSDNKAYIKSLSLKCQVQLDYLSKNDIWNISSNCQGWYKMNDTGHELQKQLCECSRLPWLSSLSDDSKLSVYTALLSSKDGINTKCLRTLLYRNLIDHQWTDNNTQILTIEGTLFNPATECVSSFRLQAERFPSGLLERRLSVNSAKMSLGYPSWMYSRNSWLQAFFSIYTLTIILYVINETLQLYNLFSRHSWFGLVYYSTQSANWMDISLISISIMFFTYIGLHAGITRRYGQLLFDVTMHWMDFTVLNIIYTAIRILLGLMIFVCFLKLLNLCRFNPKTFLLTQTVFISSGGACVIILFYLANFLIFSIAGMQIFKRHGQFRTLTEAFQTSFMLLSKGQGADRLYEIDPVMSTFWLVILWITSALVFQNFLVSFVLDNFSYVRKHHVKNEAEEVFGIFIDKVLTSLTLWRNRKPEVQSS